MISELGLVIYSALDFGLKENEERTLTPGLENLLDLMTSLGEWICIILCTVLVRGMQTIGTENVEHEMDGNEPSADLMAFSLASA